MRLLGVDFGFKRIGIAVGETEVKIASARPHLYATGSLKRDAQAILAIAVREQVDQIILGLPLENGAVGRMAGICQQLAEHLRTTGLPVVLEDESLSSVEAEATLLQFDLKASQRKKLRDGEAARNILDRYMNA